MDDASTTLNTIASQAISLSPLWGWRAEICWNSVNCRIFAEVLTFTTTSGQHEHWQFQVTHLVCQKLGTTVECQASPSIQIYRIVQVRYLGSIWSSPDLKTFKPHCTLTCSNLVFQIPAESKAFVVQVNQKRNKTHWVNQSNIIGYPTHGWWICKVNYLIQMFLDLNIPLPTKKNSSHLKIPFSNVHQFIPFLFWLRQVTSPNPSLSQPSSPDRVQLKLQLHF